MWASWPTPTTSPAGGCWRLSASPALRRRSKSNVFRRPGYALPTAIVEQCLLDTFVSPDGQSQTQVQFKLRTKSLFLQVKLPPGAKLWSAELDGVPLKPQRESNCPNRRVLIDVPAGRANAARMLKIVYAASTAPIGPRGNFVALRPSCSSVRGRGKGVRRQGPGGRVQAPLARAWERGRSIAGS